VRLRSLPEVGHAKIHPTTSQWPLVRTLALGVSRALSRWVTPDLREANSVLDQERDQERGLEDTSERQGTQARTR
jgi:hypothetical protein